MSAAPEGASRRVPWWATLLAAAGIALTVKLGYWQLGRAESRRLMQVQLDDLARQPPIQLSGRDYVAADMPGLLLRRVEASGRYDTAHQVLLDNRVYQGHAGFHVVTPLKLTGSSHYLLVNRGWVAAGAERTQAPKVITPAGDVQVRGRAVEGATHFIELSATTPEGSIWQNLVIERYRKATGLDVLPFVVQQEADSAPAGAGGGGDGLIRDWPPADLRRNTNLAYAAQWFAMALAIFLYIVILHVRSRKRPPAAA